EGEQIEEDRLESCQHGFPRFLFGQAAPCPVLASLPSRWRIRVSLRPAPTGRPPLRPLPVGRVQSYVARDLALPAVAIGEQLVLVIVKLFACLGRELEVRSLDDRVDGAGFLTKAA